MGKYTLRMPHWILRELCLKEKLYVQQSLRNEDVQTQTYSQGCQVAETAWYVDEMKASKNVEIKF